MCKIFQIRKITELFISKKLNRWGNKFAFMRFFDIKISRKLERELDSIRIGTSKLRVNLPKYRKGEVILSNKANANTSQRLASKQG